MAGTDCTTEASSAQLGPFAVGASRVHIVPIVINLKTHRSANCVDAQRRLRTLEYAEDADTNILITSAAYGISARQTLLLGLPYRLSPAGSNRQGDVSVLYRYIVRQDDSLSGTKRLGLLGGALVPTDKERDAVVQTGFVYTHFENRHEIDIDALYQAGTGNRADSGRYDLSWQYRLLPAKRPDWGIAKELNSVLELNGRWKEGSNATHQITAGMQWVHQKWVIEGGIVKDINNEKEQDYLLSIRFHF